MLYPPSANERLPHALDGPALGIGGVLLPVGVLGHGVEGDDLGPLGALHDGGDELTQEPGDAEERRPVPVKDQARRGPRAQKDGTVEPQ